MMDMGKIGAFLKELRNEKGLTQEQLAEKLGVTNRSISRWENGVNMPDFDCMLEMAEHFGVSIQELLNGERETDGMERGAEDTLLKAAEYHEEERSAFTKRIRRIFIIALIAFAIYAVLEQFNFTTATGVYDAVADFALGVLFGLLLLGILYTSQCMWKIRAYKLRLRYARRAKKVG